MIPAVIGPNGNAVIDIDENVVISTGANTGIIQEMVL